MAQKYYLRGNSTRMDIDKSYNQDAAEGNEVDFDDKGQPILATSHMFHFSEKFIKDFLPQEQYLSFLAACDVGLIILNEKMATPNFPSKAISYLNMRVPILAALDHTTDFGTYLEENNAGLWGYSDDIPTLKEKLISYYENKELREHVKENGYNLFKNHLTTQQAYQTIINKVKNG